MYALYMWVIIGRIKTTRRILDREQQDEHVLEVCLIQYLTCLMLCCYLLRLSVLTILTIYHSYVSL